MDTNINKTWIRISVFYRKEEWKNLIESCLKPYISQHQQNGNIGAIYFSFSTEQGEHVRLAFECTAVDKDKFADDVDNELTQYLEQNPSPQPAPNYIGKAFFMDHYNNSVQYNLYTLDTFNSSTIQIRSMISERFLNVFAEEDFDESSMFAFTLYMIMTFCNTWQNLYNEDINLKIAEMLYPNRNDKELDASYKVYHELFNENKEMITDIYDEVLQSQQQDDSIMNLWPIKEAYAQLLTKTGKDATFKNSTYLPLDRIVLDQTNMKLELLPSIYYVIHLCLNELLYNKQ